MDARHPAENLRAYIADVTVNQPHGSRPASVDTALRNAHQSLPTIRVRTPTSWPSRPWWRTTPEPVSIGA